MLKSHNLDNTDADTPRQGQHCHVAPNATLSRHAKDDTDTDMPRQRQRRLATPKLSTDKNQ